MQIPFTAEQFYGVFRDYNDAVWPAQVFLVALALAATLLALGPQRASFVGAQAAFFFGVPPDLGLIAAAAVAIGLLVTARLPHGATQT